MHTFTPLAAKRGRNKKVYIGLVDLSFSFSCGTFLVCLRRMKVPIVIESNNPSFFP